jgi:hypothetical protein
MNCPVPDIEPCPVLSSAMKQLGPCTVKVPTGVATLHWLEIRVTEKLLELDPTSVVVIVQAPGICILELLGLLAQAVEKTISTKISANLFISLAPIDRLSNGLRRLPLSLDDLVSS